MTETSENAENAQKTETNEELKIKDINQDKEAKEAKESKEEDYKAKYFYLAAEMDNMRKRFEREKENWIKYGNEKILSSLIDVVDNLDLTAMALTNETDPKIKNLLVGIEMVRKQFVEVLSQNGLSTVESLGKQFDPNFHEAMGKQSAEGKADNEVIIEYKKGYILNGRLLRAAKVIVAKND